jgi:hypothetical protein
MRGALSHGRAVARLVQGITAADVTGVFCHTHSASPAAVPASRSAGAWGAIPALCPS